MKKRSSVVSLLLAVAIVFSSISPIFAREGFKDMPTGWSKEYMESAVENGILKGFEGKIRPTDNITRAELATILSRVLNLKEKADLGNYKDAYENQWYYEDLAKAVESEIIKGRSSTIIDPTGLLTREEAFTMIARVFMLAYEKDGVSTYPDGNKVSEWAEPSMNAMVLNDYVEGDQNNKLNPQREITREEIAAIIHRMIDIYADANIEGKEIDGNVVVNGDVKLIKDTVIDGDLIISEGVDVDNLELDNVKVNGRVIVRGETDIDLVNDSYLEEIDSIELIKLNMDKTSEATIIGENVAIDVLDQDKDEEKPEDKDEEKPEEKPEETPGETPEAPLPELPTKPEDEEKDKLEEAIKAAKAKSKELKESEDDKDKIVNIALEEAIKEAEEVLAKEDVSQEERDNAAEKLNNILEEIAKDKEDDKDDNKDDEDKINKEALKKAIEAAKAKSEELEESEEDKDKIINIALEEAIKEAEEVLAKEDVTQKELDKAAKDLNNILEEIEKEAKPEKEYTFVEELEMEAQEENDREKLVFSEDIDKPVTVEIYKDGKLVGKGGMTESPNFGTALVNLTKVGEYELVVKDGDDELARIPLLVTGEADPVTKDVVKEGQRFDLETGFKRPVWIEVLGEKLVGEGGKTEAPNFGTALVNLTKIGEYELVVKDGEEELARIPLTVKEGETETPKTKELATNKEGEGATFVDKLEMVAQEGDKREKLVFSNDLNKPVTVEIYEKESLIGTGGMTEEDGIAKINLTKAGEYTVVVKDEKDGNVLAKIPLNMIDEEKLKKEIQSIKDRLFKLNPKLDSQKPSGLDSKKEEIDSKLETVKKSINDKAISQDKIEKQLKDIKESVSTLEKNYAEASIFKVINGMLLNESLEEILQNISAEQFNEYLNSALKAYEGLDKGQKDLLTEEKEILDQLKENAKGKNLEAKDKDIYSKRR